MTTEELERALRVFITRRPFRPFFIDFMSGDRVLATHPEAVARFGVLFYFRDASRRSRLFAASSICQLLDPPAAAGEAADNP
jgi:hypothetical protein